MEVILKAITREIKWIQAADILGVRSRTIRQMRAAGQEQGFDGLSDRRRGRPSKRRAPYEPVETVLCLYADKFFDFNVKHFHHYDCEPETVSLSLDTPKYFAIIMAVDTISAELGLLTLPE